MHGYEAEAETKREVGEIWTDKEGKEWEQKEGYKISVSQLDDVRAYLEKLNTCSSEDCNTIQYSNADKKLIRKTGKCATCLAKEESALRVDGTYPFYEDYKITNNHGEEVIVVQIAGLIARRIVCESSKDQQLQQGERIGMIRFGSRADVYFENYETLVKVGQKTIAGETLLAKK